MKSLFIILSFIIFQLSEISGQQCPPAYSQCNLGIDGYTNVHIIAHTHDDVG